MAVDDLHLKIIAMSPRSMSMPMQLLEKYGYADVRLRPDIIEWCDAHSIDLTLHYVLDTLSYDRKSIIVGKFGTVEQAFEFKMRWF